MALTLFDRIWNAHVVADLGDGWALLHIDRHLLHDLSGAGGLEEVESRGLTVSRPDLTFATADHGNCEMMRDPVSHGPHTAHTTNPVPVVLYGGPAQQMRDGRLADIAPTLLRLMGLQQPAEMTGTCLF
jgi:hypothetical protein